jgi:hypothetical protein
VFLFLFLFVLFRGCGFPPPPRPAAAAPRRPREIRLAAATCRPNSFVRTHATFISTSSPSDTQHLC